MSSVNGHGLGYFGGKTASVTFTAPDLAVNLKRYSTRAGPFSSTRRLCVSLHEDDKVREAGSEA